MLWGLNPHISTTSSMVYTFLTKEQVELMKGKLTLPVGSINGKTLKWQYYNEYIKDKIDTDSIKSA